MNRQKKTTAEKHVAAEPAPATEAKPAPEKKGRARARASVWEKVPETGGGPAPAKAPEPKAAKKGTAKPKRPADEIMPKARASDPLVVFAFRLSEAEREEIHAAAGPARASRFVRAVALAAARRDVAQLQSILLETQREAAG